MCAPFWWSIGIGNQPATILNNGTICYVNTGTCELGITANHVYQKYLVDLEEHGPDAVECQFGGSTISPEKHAVAQSRKRDLATFQIPEVFVTAAFRNPRTQHHPTTWPPARAVTGDVVVYGGYPGVIRVERGAVADLPFQWILGRVSDTGYENIVLEPQFRTSQWLGDQRNDNPGGMSGGPVFRVLEETITRLEIVGFIHEFSYEEAILARHADAVLADGAIVQS